MQAWKLWTEGRSLELMDAILTPSFMEFEVVKCIQIGLLCVQEDPADRPTMSSVIVMLASDTMTTTLPKPTEPAFSVGRVVRSAAQPQQNEKGSSVNDMTLSNVLPR